MEISFGNNKNLKEGNAVNPKQKNQNNIPEVKEAFEQISVINRRLKILENSLSTLRSTVQNIEKNMIDNTKSNTRDIRALEEENTELKDSIHSMKENMKKIINDMQNTARSEEVKVIQGYLDLWNPVKFTTQEQVKKICIDVCEDIILKENYSESRTLIQNNIDNIQKQKQNL